MSTDDYARAAYQGYYDSHTATNRPPTWENLSSQERTAWRAATLALLRSARESADQAPKGRLLEWSPTNEEYSR